MSAIFRFVAEPAGVSLVGAEAAAATTVTVPAHRGGDLLVFFAFRTATTAPSLPAGVTNINSASGGGTSFRAGYRVATAPGTTSGTWTNATHLTVQVFRGADVTTPVGANVANSDAGSSNTINFPALTLQKTDGTSWVMAAAGHSAGDSGVNAPAGMVQRDSIGTGPWASTNDTDGGAPSWSATTLTVDTPGLWRSFVVEIRSAVTTLLDINAGPLTVKDGDFTLGAPQWTAEPDTISDDDGYREMRLVVGADNSYTDAAAAMSSLSRVLQQPSGWFMFQRETEHRPMFLRWYRTPPGELSWEHAYIDTYRLPVTLVCDPYAYAEPVVLATQTIDNNPASTNANKASYVLPAVRGDAPALLKVDIVPITTDWTGYEPFMASTSYVASQAWSGPILWDLTAAQWTAGSDTGGDTASSLYVGGSLRTVTFATFTDMRTRLTGGPSTAPIPGSYKVLMRVGMNIDQSTVKVRMGQVFNLTQVRWGDTKTIVRPDITLSTLYQAWVDMGEFSFPLGAENLDASDIGGVTAPSLQIQAERTEGTTQLTLDAILLIPKSTAATIVDSRMQRSRFHGFGIETDRSGVWDGQKQRFMAYDFGTNLANIRHPEIRGGWLRVVPGANNVFHLLQQSMVDTPFFTDAAYADVIAQQASVTLSYLPRYLHLRPDSE